MRRAYRIAVFAVATLPLAGCEQTPHCSLPNGPHIAVAHSRPMTIHFSKDYAELFFNGRLWVFEGKGPAIPSPLFGPAPPVSLRGTMNVWRKDVAVFRSDDGRTFTFLPRGVGCA
jgi:hypothetical protein